MKNNQKIDIKLESDLSSNKNLSEEQRCQAYYDTALRYINIAKYMKQYEDQDKYYNKALVNLKKASAGMPEVKPLQKEVKDKQYYARAKGKIELYTEAVKIKDNARTPTDYFSAQTIFDRIHKYEAKHPIPESSVSPELFEQVLKCSDSEQQSALCGELAQAMMKKQSRRSTFTSTAILVIIILFLAFTRTTLSRICLAKAYAVTGHYGKAFTWYDYAYKKTNNPEYFEQYKKYRYLAATNDLKTTNTEPIRNSLRELARLNYKDSEQYLVKAEKSRIAEMDDGEKIRFGEVNWRILKHDGNKALLLKDKTVGQAPFRYGGGKASWSSSSIRTWLNDEYINELFTFDLEKAAIMETAVPAETNHIYGTAETKETKDKLFLLSADEFRQYSDLIPGTHNLWWLRTPGNSETSTAFVSTDKTIMLYGYENGSDNVKARPAIWVDLKK